MKKVYLVSGEKFKIDFEQIVEIIVREVISELSRLGVEIEFSSGESQTERQFKFTNSSKCSIIDMKEYVTPILTEDKIESLEPEVIEIVVPEDTILTLGARDIINKRNIKLIINK